MVAKVPATDPLAYATMGLSVLPLCWPDSKGNCACGRNHKERDIAKAPLTAHGLKDATTDTTQIKRWVQLYPKANYGAAIATSNLVVVDTDSEDAEVEAEALGTPFTYAVMSGGGEGHVHRYYRRPEAVPLARTIHQGDSKHIDLLSDGYVVLPPSLHASGRHYEWLVSPDDEGAELAEAPRWAIRLLCQAAWSTGLLTDPALDLLLGIRCITDDATGDLDRSGTIYALASELLRAGAPATKVSKILADRDQVLGRSWAKGPKFAHRGDAQARYEQTVEAAAAALAREPKLLIGKGGKAPATKAKPTAFHAVTHNAPDLTEEQARTIPGAPHSDAGNVEIISLLFGDTTTYDPVKGRWLRWGEHTWEAVRKEVIEELVIQASKARLQAVAMSAGLPDTVKRATEQWAYRSQNNFQVQGTAAVARAAMGQERPWDENDYLLGCANGVVDLHTGEFRAGRKEDWISLSTGVAYDPEATCPRWEQFLGEVFDGKDALVTTVHRAVGYSLTGSNNEECLFLMHGTGRNGKGTIDHVMRRIMGEYCQPAPFQTFEDTKNGNDGPSNDLAMLAGKRVVAASESKEGRRLNEALVKRATGRDPITARFLYKEFFTYMPRFKVWLSCNHLPIIRGRDSGIWSRIRLLPFEVSFWGREDHSLRDTLDTELPGILAWAVRGCLEWQAEGGLRIDQCPPEMTKAVTEYRQDMDTVRPFLDDCCVLPTGSAEGKEMTVEAGRLYKAYKMWVESQGEYVASHRSFALMLQEHGIDRHRSATQRQYKGVGLNELGAGYAARNF